MSDEKTLGFRRNRIRTFVRRLMDHFSRNEGVLIGEASLASRKVHLEPRDSQGTVHVYQDRDAGVTYLKLIERDLAVHVDVLHHPADINIEDLASRIKVAIPAYLTLMSGDAGDSPEAMEALTLNTAQRIFLKTATAQGTVLEPVHDGGPPGGRLCSHVHVVATIPEKYYGLIYIIIEQVEKAIIFQGCQLRPVLNIIHSREAGETSGNFTLGVPETI